MNEEIEKTKARRNGGGFTLLEVVIALAVFGFLIGGLLGFLPWGVEGVGKVRDQNVAYGLVDATQIELERMGFSLVEKGTTRWTNPTNPREMTPLHVLLVARKEGGQVATVTPAALARWRPAGRELEEPARREPD